MTRGTGLLERFLAGKRYGRAAALIPDRCRAGRMLDVGCGQYPAFLTTAECTTKIGIDRLAAHHYAATGSTVTVALHDVTQETHLPFRSASFSIVTALAVLEHIPEAHALHLLREVHRILRPEGVLVMTTPAAWADRVLRLLAFLRLVSPEEIDEHVFLCTPQRLRTHLEHAGFPAESITAGYFECWMNLWCRAEKQAVLT